MKRRNSAAIIAWAIPVCTLLAAAAVSTDVDMSSRPASAHRIAPSSTATAEVRVEVLPPVPPTTATGNTTRVIGLFSPPPEPEPALDAERLDAAITSIPAPQPGPPQGATTSTPADPDEYELDIPTIALSEPVVGGGQAELDQGHVTAVDWASQGYPASCLPGEGCTVWIAGHRTTHGAVFARLPELTASDPIVIHFHAQVYTYAVIDIETVPGTAPPAVIHGDLVLQTSAPNDHRILVYAAAV